MNKVALELATLLAALIAAVASVYAAVFAAHQVEISRDSEQRQLRAYVGTTVQRADGLNGKEPMVFTFTMKNFGATPAYQARYGAEVLLLPYPLPEGVQVAFGRENLSPTTIQPGSEIGGTGTNKSAFSPE